MVIAIPDVGDGWTLCEWLSQGYDCTHSHVSFTPQLSVFLWRFLCQSHWHIHMVFFSISHHHCSLPLETDLYQFLSLIISQFHLHAILLQNELLMSVVKDGVLMQWMYTWSIWHRFDQCYLINCWTCQMNQQAEWVIKEELLLQVVPWETKTHLAKVLPNVGGASSDANCQMFVNRPFRHWVRIWP
jgi:hypothetical protein